MKDMLYEVRCLKPCIDCERKLQGWTLGSRPLLLRIFSRMSRTRRASLTTKINKHGIP